MTVIFESRHDGVKRSRTCSSTSAGLSCWSRDHVEVQYASRGESGSLLAAAKYRCDAMQRERQRNGCEVVRPRGSRTTLSTSSTRSQWPFDGLDHARSRLHSPATTTHGRPSPPVPTRTIVTEAGSAPMPSIDKSCNGHHGESKRRAARALMHSSLARARRTPIVRPDRTATIMSPHTRSLPRTTTRARTRCPVHYGRRIYPARL